MPDHDYTYPVKNNGDITIDVFNLDMNDAESHGAVQVCCQYYSYANGDDATCKRVNRGHQYCAGGDGDMFDACMKQLNDWADDSCQKLATEVAKSTATWKIVHSHYSPYAHYGEPKILIYIFWINGHRNGEKHDYAAMRMYFIENGAGGGIQSESASGIPPYAGAIANVWTAGELDTGNTYGFFFLVQ